jgi:hypothetical protein
MQYAQARWRRPMSAAFTVSPCGTHHVDADGQPAYAARFDEVLKFHAPGLAPVRRGAEAFHIGPDGLAAYSRRFVRTFGYYEGLAAVVSPEGWHHIDPAGADAYPQRHGWCGNVQQGRCAVRAKDGRYHHIRPDGAAAYAARWGYVGDYRDGVAVVQADDGRSTHINRDGALLHARWFVDLDVFHKGYARARDEDGWMHIDREGRPIYAARFVSVEPFYNGQARVEREDGALLIIDEQGTLRAELRAPRRSALAALSGDMVGFWRTQTLAAAVQFGLPEALPATAAAVAAQRGLTEDGAHRLLRALGELGVATCAQGVWSLLPRGEFLRVDHPMTLAAAALEYAGPFTDLWRALPEALRQGGDWRAPDVFGLVAGDPARVKGHHIMLRSYARHDYVAVVPALSLRGDERIVDAGGGLGVLAEQIARAHPAAQVTVLERPEVVELAPDGPANVHFVAGDLFAPWGMAADLVILSRVLHDWSDDRALALLTQARAALLPGGRLCLLEMVIPEGSLAGGLCDLHLLMATGGRERSVADFARLLEGAGLCLVEQRALPALPTLLIAVAA